MRQFLAALAATVSFPAFSSAALDEDDKQWMEGVRVLMLDDEAKILESLKTREDRLEFRKIFWARRDPDLGTPENEFQKIYDERRPIADKRFFVGTDIPVAKSTDRLGSRPRQSNDPFATHGTADMEESELRMHREQRLRDAMSGALTDCGLTFIMFGDPDDIEKRTHTVWGDREPQRWVYRSRDTRILFDEACMMPVGNDKVRRQLKEYAIVQPAILYHVKGGELLKKLADMMPKPTPMGDLMRAPRQDFPVVAETYFLKGAQGTGIFGLVRGDGSTLFREEAAGGKVRLRLRIEATPEQGGAPAAFERETLVEVDAKGAFVASYNMDVKPGPQALKVAVLDANSSKGTVLTQTADVPAFATGELTIAPLMALEGLEEGVKRDAKHPLAAFTVGNTRLRPRLGHVFSPSESLHIFYQFYDPKADPATQKPSAVAKVRILRSSGTPVAEAPEDAFDTPVGANVIGPVALSRYAPGVYKIQLKVMDNVAGKIYTQEGSFEIRADNSAAAVTP